MNVTTHEANLATLDGLRDLDALCLFIASDERPLKGIAGHVDWRLCGGLSRVLLAGFFTGELGERLLFPSSGRVAPGRIFVVGLGSARELSPQRLHEALGGAGRMLTRANVQSVAFELPGAEHLSDDDRAQALREAFLREFKGAYVALMIDKRLKPVLETLSAAAG